MLLTIGISGKRFVAAEDRDRLIVDLKTEIDALLKQYNTRQFTGLSSLAVGADSIFADLVLNHYHQPLIAILPFPVEEYRNDFSSEELADLDRYIYSASEVKTLSEHPLDQRQRETGYLQAGKYIANQAQELLIVWDKLKPVGKGGTAEILAYRNDTDKIPAKLFPVSPKKADTVAELIQREYNQFDSVAKSFRDRYKFVWRLSLFMAWLAVMIFAATTAFKIGHGLGWALSLTELILVVAVFSIVYVAKKKAYHGNYLKARMEAERYRLFELFYNANIELEISQITKKENQELGKVVKVINDGITSSKFHSHLFSRYVIAELISGQKAYHEGKIKGVERKPERLDKFNYGIGILFLANVVSHFSAATLHHFFHVVPPHWLEELIVFLSICLPASYAAIEGFMYFQEYEATKKNSEDILKKLDECLALSPKINDLEDGPTCRNEQGKCMSMLANAMLSDNHSWHSLLENKGNYHWIV